VVHAGVPLRGSSAKSRFSKLYALLFERFDYFGSVGTSWWRGDFFQERVEDGLGIEWYSRSLGAFGLTISDDGFCGGTLGC
jgi:hypothetical protein